MGDEVFGSAGKDHLSAFASPFGTHVYHPVGHLDNVVVVLDDNDAVPILVYCESKNYVAKNNLRNEAYSKQEVSKFQEKYGTAEDRDPEKTKAYNEDILGLKYADDGETILNPFAKPANQAPEEEVLTCDDGSAPDANGCCTGETYTDMGEQGFNCCPDSGGDCFPPITVE